MMRTLILFPAVWALSGMLGVEPLGAQTGDVRSVVRKEAGQIPKDDVDWHPEEIKILERLDLDRDGTLQPSEVPEVAKDFVDKLARRAGLSPLKPILLTTSLSEVRRQWWAYPIVIISRMDRDGDGVVTPGEVPAKGKSFVARVAEEAGFDRRQEFRLDALAYGYRRYLDSMIPFGGVGIEPSGKRSDSVEAAALHAETLIRIYDTNQDQALDRQEWSQLNADWGDADRDGNGKLEGVEVAYALYKLSR